MGGGAILQEQAAVIGSGGRLVGASVLPMGIYVYMHLHRQNQNIRGAVRRAVEKMATC